METKEKRIKSNSETALDNAIIDSSLGDEKEKKKTHFTFKLFSKTKLFLVLILIVIIAAAISFFSTKQGKLETIATSSLESIVEISELSTVDYTYNAIAKKQDKNGNVLYHVAYEGTITAGIDFNDIKFEVFESEKRVIITVPQVSIHEISVTTGTMEYIFTDDDYNTETVAQEAYKLCLDDLKSRADKENTLFNTARENAISSVTALFQPWIDSLSDSYTVEVK